MYYSVFFILLLMPCFLGLVAVSVFHFSVCCLSAVGWCLLSVFACSCFRPLVAGHKQKNKFSFPRRLPPPLSVACCRRRLSARRRNMRSFSVAVPSPLSPAAAAFLFPPLPALVGGRQATGGSGWAVRVRRGFGCVLRLLRSESRAWRLAFGGNGNRLFVPRPAGSGRERLTALASGTASASLSLLVPSAHQPTHIVLSRIRKNG